MKNLFHQVKKNPGIKVINIYLKTFHCNSNTERVGHIALNYRDINTERVGHIALHHRDIIQYI